MKLLRLIVFSRALLVQVKGFQNIFQQFHRTIAYDVRKNMGALLCTDIPAEKEENSATNPVATASNVAVVENTKKVPQPKAEKIPYIVTFGKDPAIADDGIERGPNPMTTVRYELFNNSLLLSNMIILTSMSGPKKTNTIG